LKYSRDPECFHALLQTDPQLEECRLQLKNHGLPFRLPSGAYIFVQPDEHSAVLEYISEQEVQLGPSHVLVSEAVEDVVTQCVASLPRKHKLLVKNRLMISSARANASSDIPGGGSGCAELSDVPVVLQRTFIHFPIPSSLRSTPSGGPRTSSTTDANPRAGNNPRSSACKR